MHNAISCKTHITANVTRKTFGHLKTYFLQISLCSYSKAKINNEEYVSVAKMQLRIT